MKIIYIITRLDSLGGAQVHVRDMAVAMSKRGHAVLVITGLEGAFCSDLQKQGVVVSVIKELGREIRLWKDLLATIRLFFLVRKEAPDLLSLHSSKAGWLGRIIGRLLGVPVVFTAHGWAFGGGISRYRSLFYRLLEKIAGIFSQKVITVCDRDRVVALQYGLVPRDRLCTIHNGVIDLPNALLANPYIDPVRIVMTARFQEPKQHVALLQALKDLRNIPWELEFVGDGPMVQHVQDVVDRYEMQDRVVFSGACLDVGQRLSRAQIFALISDREGFPRSILEAMRAGLPVIASNVGGVCEAVEDGGTGFLIDPGDHGRLAKCLKTLIADPRLRALMGKAGRKQFVDRFLFETMFDKTLYLYRDILAHNNKAFRPGRYL